MAYKIAVANEKGGVGKSTTSINLSDALTYMQYRVLLIDLDPQCNSTAIFLDNRENEESQGKTLADVFINKKSIKDCITKTAFGDIVCGSPELKEHEDRFIRQAGGLKIIKNALKEIEDDYDFVVMDTPPNTGSYMRNALFAANGIITPIEAKRFALDGLSSFIDTVNLLKDDGNDDLTILGVLLNRYDQRNGQDREVKEALPAVLEELDINPFKAHIRICQDIEKCLSESKSLFKTCPNSNGANDYADLAIEIIDLTSK